MFDLLWFSAATISHAGLMLAAYNFINSTGLPRWATKTISKAMVLFAVAVPAAAAWQMFVVGGGPSGPTPRWVVHWARAVVAVGVYHLVRFVATRPGLESTAIDAPRRTERLKVQSMVDVDLARTTKCRWCSRFPGTQIFDLSVEHIDLPVSGLPAELDGYKISHLSDFHFTGDIDPAFASVAMDRAWAFDPDMMVVTGDIIDHADCLDWLPGVFGRDGEGSPLGERLRRWPNDGCHFILGNHDLRHGNDAATRAAMRSIGWNDVGGRAETMVLRGVPVQLIGNEAPWFDPPSIDPPSESLRIVLSHSPDQIQWARRHGATLMLAGHTHGGQGRLPILGPLIAPSRYGTRFASGDFYLSPTTMHVTRGISGKHLLRIHCPPELSLLTLRCGG